MVTESVLILVTAASAARLREDGMERLDVEFQSEGATVRAWVYRAEGGGRRPTVVLAGGWCYVREIVMPTYAKAFTAAGINAHDLRLSQPRR